MASDALNAPAPPPSNLLDLPFNIQNLRSQFFAMDAPVTMSVSEFNAAWRFLDNIYVKNSSRRSRNRLTEYYWCRLWPKKSHESRVPPEKRQRNRTIRAAVACPCKIKAVSDGAMITFSRIGEGHNHEYSALEYKVTTGVRELAAKEIAKGYKPSEIAQILKSTNAEIIQAAGGGGLKLKDIHNAGQVQRRSIPQPKDKDDDETKAVAHRGEKIREVLDGLHRKYYELESSTSDWPSDARDEAICHWINQLDQVTQFLRRETVDQLRNRLKPESPRAVPEAQGTPYVSPYNRIPGALESPVAGQGDR